MSYSEADTRANHIDPALNDAGWRPQHIRREYSFTAGRKLFGGKRGDRCRLDYLLLNHNRFIGIIEAKSSDKEPTEGLQQAIDYAQKLKVRFVYATNGKRIYEFDCSTGKGDYVDTFPTPDALYARVVEDSTPLKDKLLTEPFLITGPMQPRYYQELAVQKVMEGIAEGKKRMLLTLATGTGKTFIAFQIVHKLLQAKWNIAGADRRPRVLFLADRNILADQAINTFNPYEKDLVKITGDEIRKRDGKVPTNAYIFFAIYQAISDKGRVSEEDESAEIGGYYRSYPADFFDLIIIDECHRGSATEGGSWRAILDHFKPAVHLGLTATPRRSDNVDTYNYFGQPLYEYSLKEGINDGFLTPYKTKRIRTSLDEYIYTSDDKVISGSRTKNLYTLSEFDRAIIIPERTDMVARAILDNIRPMDKTIVFCVDQNHALQMRDAINLHKQSADPQYCVRVTSDEGIIGRRLLERFQDNDKDTPVILTSSQMLTTGVDARNVRNIVICRTINSIVEFKQIVGRGTRIFEGKDFFTILDFTGATNHFYDPEWDGLPVDTNEDPPTPKPPRTPKPEPPEGGIEDPPGGINERLVIKLANGRSIHITDIEVRFTGADGRPMSPKEFLDELALLLPTLFKDEEELRTRWSNPESREDLLRALERLGFNTENLDTLTEIVRAKDSDYYDLLSFLSFHKEILSRSRRAGAVKSDAAFLSAYPEKKAQDFLLFMLRRYEQDGIKELGKDKLPQLIQLAGMGTAREAGGYFGGMQQLHAAYLNLQRHLYL